MMLYFVGVVINFGLIAANYCGTGTLTSTNLLSGQTVSGIDAFGYNASSIPSGTSLKVQFSNDGSTWKNSSGTTDGWDTLSQGNKIAEVDGIDISGLGWSSANFYYKMQFDSNTAQDETPVLDEVKVYYSSNSTPSNTSLILTNPYSGNQVLSNDSTEYTFRAVVEDADGYDDIDTVELRLATSADNTTPYQALEFTWTQDGDEFTKTLDTGSVASITSTGTDSTCSSNSCTLDFKLKFNNSFATKSTNYNAELYTTDASSDTDEDSYSTFYQVLPVYTIQNATNINAALSSDWSTSVETTAQYGEVEVGVMSTGDLPVSKFTVDFDEDHDWSNLSADSSSVDKRAYMHNTSGFDSIPGNVDSNYVLYVPKVDDDAMIGICPGATSLSGVDKTCDNLYILKSADANVSDVEIAGDDYWAISGLTSTGGFSFSAYGEDLELRNVEVIRIGESRYLVAATTGGVTVTNEESWVSYDSDYNELVYKAVASDNGNLYFITAENDLQVVYDITDLTDDFSTDITYSATSTPAITASDVDLNNIYVQTGTSWIDGYSNVIYLASDEGVVVINEKQGDETNGSVKYFTKDYVTEDLTGDVRGMWGFATDNADTALAVGDSLSSSDQIDGYSALDSDLEVYGTPDVVDGVRGTALEFNGSTDYLVQELYDSEQGTVSGTLTDGSAQLTDSSQDFDSWDTEGGSGSAVYLVEVTDNSGDAIWGYLYDESTDDGGSDTSVDIENSLDGTGSQNWSGDTSTFSFGDTPIVYEIKDTKFQLTGDFSLGAWVKYDSKDNYMRILDKYPSDNSSGYLLGLDGSTDQKFGLYVRIPSDIQKGIPSKTVPEIGTWYFVVAVYDSSAGTIYIYVNGELENLNNEVGSEILAGGTSFAVGCKEANGTKYMDGVIDEPFVFAEALSSEQIKHLYEIGNRSLQNHESSNLSGVSVDSDFQQLYGDTNISTSLTVDNTKGLMYVGTNDSSNSGGVSVINLSSDSLIDIYSNQSSKIDMSGAYWESTYNDIESIDVSSNLIGDESSNVLIASDEILWSGSSDVSLLNVVNDLSSSTLVKDLLVAKQINMKGDIKPDVAGVYDLGSSDLYWSGAYADTFYSTSATIGSFDIAEDFYAMDPNIQAGDVVAFADGRASAIDKTSVLYQRDVVGVISTQPGITLSYWRGDAEEIKNMRPVALAGRVPVKVTDENGVIEKGDFLVPASKPGYAMKACGVKYCEPAMVIGRALETFESDQLGDSEEVSTELVNSRIEVDEQLSNSQTEHPLEELGTLLLDPSGSITEQETVEDGIVAAVGAVEDVLTQVMDQSNTSVGEGRIMMFVDLMWYVPVGYEGVNDLDMTVDDRLEYLGQALDTVELNTTAWTLEGSVLSAQADIVANAFYSDSVAFSIVTSEVIKVGGSNFVVDSQGNVDMAGDLKIAGVLSGKYGDLKVILGDDQGQTALNIENNEGDTVFSVDSEGQLHAYEIGIIDSEDKTLGRAKLLAGKDSLKILSSAINPDVKIFITPRMNDDSVEIPRLVVSNKQDGFFVVSLDEISTVDIDFDWWVVE